MAIGLKDIDPPYNPFKGDELILAIEKKYEGLSVMPIDAEVKPVEVFLGVERQRATITFELEKVDFKNFKPFKG